MKTIEVEWKITPVFGLTEIDLQDLGCKTLTEWYKLDKEEQKERVKEQLRVYDLSIIEFHITNF